MVPVEVSVAEAVVMDEEAMEAPCTTMVDSLVIPFLLQACMPLRHMDVAMANPSPAMERLLKVRSCNDGGLDYSLLTIIQVTVLRRTDTPTRRSSSNPLPSSLPCRVAEGTNGFATKKSSGLVSLSGW